ncbi:hypothetical protein ACLESD_23795 [Pyxidicoccus sp. 3LFB2]
MMLATWPAQSPDGVTQSVDALIAGVRPLPGGEEAAPATVSQAPRR